MCTVKIMPCLRRDEDSASAFTLVFESIVASLLMANNASITFTHKASSGFPKEPNILSKDFPFDQQRVLPIAWGVFVFPFCSYFFTIFSLSCMIV